ncbi:MAG: response regulator [Pseudomonadota bacterium]
MHYNEKILIVDDEHRMRDSLKALLTPRGYEITTCGNGLDAMAYLTKIAFDLVLLDIGMEKMDGFQVMERMARQHLDIPVIIMTGHVSTASAVEALRKGAYDYLRKPFEPDELFTSVKNALNQGMLAKDSHLKTIKLRESEERFRRLAENAKDMIYRMSLPDGTYEYVSPASIDLFGYPPEAFYETPDLIKKVVHPGWAYYCKTQWANLLAGDMPPVYEYQIIHKTGEERWLHQRNVLIRGDNGQPMAIEGIVSDITERKRREDEREKIQAQNWQLQKAESLNRMAGAIAHHFNNQLMVVMGNLELLMENLSLSDIQLKNMTKAIKATRRAGEVSSLMLTYLGQTTSRLEPIDMGEICYRSLPLVRAVLPKRIHLETGFPSPGPTINGNANQMQQVLINLITNAIEAAGDGVGAIELTVRTVLAGEIPATHRFPIGWEPRHNIHACLEIADGGCGIAGKEIEKIFDPFFTTKSPGRGLGLSVVLGLVRAHGGTISVESEPGRGSLFRVFLPVSAATIIPFTEKTGSTPERVGENMLLQLEEAEPVRKIA